MYYSYVEIEYVATSFSPARTDLAVKLLRNGNKLVSIQRKDKKIKMNWQLDNSNRCQIECLVHKLKTIIIIELFTKS
jgi:hypothetical protein